MGEIQIISSLLSGAIGGVLVAFINYFLDKQKEREAEWRKEKLKFYIKFVESLSGVTDCEGTPENDVIFAKACNDLYLFASSKVLNALQKYQDEIRITNNNKSYQSYERTLSNLLFAIREDIDINNSGTNSLKVRLWTSGIKKEEK